MVRSGIKRPTLSITIDGQLFKNFDDFCKKNDKNKSRVIEKLIIKYLEENK